MAVDAGSLIEPAVAEAGVHAHDEIVPFSVTKKITHIKPERRVSVVVASDEIAVQEHQRTAEGSIEFNNNPASRIFLRNVECAPVPADAGFGITPPQRLVSVAILFLISHEWQFDAPIVRQVQLAPFRVIKFLRRKPELAALGEISLSL